MRACVRTRALTLTLTLTLALALALALTLTPNPLWRLTDRAPGRPQGVALRELLRHRHVLVAQSGRDRAEVDETGRDRAEIGGSISASEIRGSTHLGAISAGLGARPLATDGDATTLDLVNQELTLT